MQLEMAIRLPKEAETVALIRATVAQILTVFGVTQECLDDVRLALSEACTNVIVHARSDDQYEVRVRVDDQRCALSVTNTGEGFDTSGLSPVLPEPQSERGRGLAIMSAVMDTMELVTEPEAGTVVHLGRALSFNSDSPLRYLRRPQS
jgi:serine/threonine-protein kinase RsbW